MNCQGGNHVWTNGALVCECGEYNRALTQVDRREQNVAKRTPTSVAHQVTCHACKGKGQIHIAQSQYLRDCPVCGGRGYLKRKL